MPINDTICFAVPHIGVWDSPYLPFLIHLRPEIMDGGDPPNIHLGAAGVEIEARTPVLATLGTYFRNALCRPPKPSCPVTISLRTTVTGLNLSASFSFYLLASGTV